MIRRDNSNSKKNSEIGIDNANEENNNNQYDDNKSAVSDIREPEDEDENDNDNKPVKINLPFNNKIIMILITIFNFLSGVAAAYYAFICLYYMNNPNFYKKHYIDIYPDMDKGKVNNIIQQLNAEKINYYSIVNNLLIFGFIQVISSFFAFLIRVPRFNVSKDMYPYILYESLSNISCFGLVILWFIMMKINNILVLNGVESLIKYFSLITSIISFGFKILTLIWSFQDYFDVIRIEDLILN